MDLPYFVDFDIAENEAFALGRGVNVLGRGWKDLLAVAQTVLIYFQDIPDLAAPEFDRLMDYRAASPLVGAARILDAMATFAPEISDLERDDLNWQAAVAYAMYGNFVSANAVLKRLAITGELSPVRSVIAATCAPRSVGDRMLRATDSTNEFQYLGKLAGFLRRGWSEDLFGALGACIEDASDPFESALLLSTRLALHQVIKLSARRTLASTGLPSDFVSNLLNDNILTLLPPQYAAVERGVVSDKRNAFVSLPTSSGKTLLGELCMISSLLGDNDVACFVAPYIAVGRQVADTLRRHLPPNVAVCEMFGAFGSSSGAALTSGQCIIVATPERFDGLLRSFSGLRDRLRCIVFDEAHLVGNDQRGLRLEAMIARLLLLQSQGFAFRIVALSAVIAEPSAFCDWLRVPTALRFVDGWRPTARRLGVWLQEGTLQWYRSDDIVQLPSGTANLPLGQRTVPWPQTGVYPAQQLGAVNKVRPKLYENVGYLADLLNTNLSPPTLCICSSRSGTRTLADAIAVRFSKLASIGPKLQALIELIENKLKHLRPLAEMARHGVAYHNSALPQAVRFLIEDAVKEGSLKVVAATTTLAEGVDLPFRNTIIADWLVYRHGREQPMPALLFRNIAGRCGRAGTFTEGDTIIFDNMLGDLEFTSPGVRNNSRDRLLAEPPPLKSLLAEELEDGSPELGEAEAILASQFLAAIGENQANDNLKDAFASCMYGSFSGQSEQLHRKLNHTQARLIDSSQPYVFAAVASPIRYTPLGRAANLTGFSPASCVAILEYLERRNSFRDAELIADLVIQLSQLPEQRDERWKEKVVNPRKRLMIGPDDLPEIITSWLNGVEYADIFAELPAAKRSSRAVSVSQWKIGDTAAKSWADEYEKFLDFCTSVLERFVPWVLQAAAILEEHTLSQQKQADWPGIRSRVLKRISADQDIVERNSE